MRKLGKHRKNSWVLGVPGGASAEHSLGTLGRGLAILPSVSGEVGPLHPAEESLEGNWPRGCWVSIPIAGLGLLGPFTHFHCLTHREAESPLYHGPGLLFAPPTPASPCGGGYLSPDPGSHCPSPTLRS